MAQQLPVSVGYANYQTVLANVGALREFCQGIEELGYAGVQVQDHVAYPWDETAYVYPGGGKAAHRPGMPVLEALTFLSVAAGCSSRLGLETSVLVLPQRHPLLVAKQAAALDRLSGGRLLLGVGPGWLTAEVRALGVDPGTRGARMDEALEVLVRALDDEHVAFSGEFFSVDDVSLEPRPARRARELMWVGGGDGGAWRRAARRVGRYGAGWLVNPRFPLDGVDAVLARAAQEAEVAGRGPVSFGVDHVVLYDGDDDRTAQTLLSRREVGRATRFSVLLGGVRSAATLEELLGLAARFAAVAELAPPP